MISQLPSLMEDPARAAGTMARKQEEDTDGEEKVEMHNLQDDRLPSKSPEMANKSSFMINDILAKPRQTSVSPVYNTDHRDSESCSSGDETDNTNRSLHKDTSGSDTTKQQRHDSNKKQGK